MRTRSYKEIQKEQNSLSQFTGKDLTRKVDEQNSGFFSFLRRSNSKPVTDDFGEEVKKIKKEDKELPLWRRRKVVIPTLISAFFIIFTFLFYSSIASITVDIEVIQEEILVSEKVKADPNTEVPNSAELTVPAELIIDETISKSVTGTATGSGAEGEKAKGFVYIFNKTEREIELTSGTVFTNLGSDLNYVLISDVILPAGTREDEGPITPSRTDGVALEASKFGEEYNIQDSTDDVTFSIEGFQGVSVLEAKLDSSFVGGTSTEFTTPSQEDLDTLKEIELKTLEEETFASIIEQYEGRSDVLLLEDTLVFEADEVTSFPAVGEKAEDETFTLNLSGKVTGLVIEVTDLEELMVEVINQNNPDSEPITQEDIVKVDVSEVVRDGDTAVFTADVRGQSVDELDEEALKSEITWTSLDNVVMILEEDPNIESAKVKFTPSFTPGIFQRSPLSTSQITFRISIAE